MRDQLNAACRAVYERKQAIFPGAADGEFLDQLAAENGLTPDQVTGFLLLGFDLAPGDLVEMAQNYAYSVMFADPDPANRSASGWADGFLHGCHYMQRLARETETPPEANTGAVPSETRTSVSRRFVVRRTLARVAARLRGEI